MGIVRIETDMLAAYIELEAVSVLWTMFRTYAHNVNGQCLKSNPTLFATSNSM